MTKDSLQKVNKPNSMKRFINVMVDERVVMFIILLNATLFIALDINPGLVKEIGSWVEWIDFACVVFFVFEAGIKISRDSFKVFLKDHWNKFDLFIVIASIPVLIEPFLYDISFEYGWVGVFRIARVFRLTRVLRTLRIVKYTHNNPSKIFLKVKFPVYLILAVASSKLLLEIFDVTADWTLVYHKFYPSAIIVGVTWLISRLYVVLHESRIQPHLQSDKTQINEAVESIISALSQIAIWTIGLIIAFEKAGYDSTTILAGIGLGGMAVALAAQDFIGNIIGGILLYFKDSFKVGDSIAISGYEGEVVKLGISDIRIRDLSGKVTSLPNKLFITEPIENKTEADLAPDTIKLRIHKNMTSDKLKEAIDFVFDEAKSNVYIKDDFSVRFGPMSKDVHELNFEYYLDKDGLINDQPNEPLQELINAQNAIIYIHLIGTFQKSEIQVG